MKTTLISCAFMAALIAQGRQAETPTTAWTIYQNQDAIAYDHGRLHIVSWAAGDTANHAYATLQLPIPQKVKSYTIEFELKLGEAASAPAIFEARAGERKPLFVSYSSKDNRCHIQLAGNEVFSDIADDGWHTFKLSYEDGRLSLSRDKETLGSLPNRTVPDLLRFGGEFGLQGRQSEAWARIVTAKFTPAPAEKGTTVTVTEPTAENPVPERDRTLLSRALCTLEVSDVSNPKGSDPAIQATQGEERWYLHVALTNDGNTPLNYFDFGPAWIKFDNYQSISGQPYTWDDSLANSATKGKGMYRIAKRSECWLQPGKSVDVFYCCNSANPMTGKPVSVEFVSGGTFKYPIPPP